MQTQSVRNKGWDQCMKDCECPVKNLSNMLSVVESNRLGLTKDIFK